MVAGAVLDREEGSGVEGDALVVTEEDSEVAREIVRVVAWVVVVSEEGSRAG